MATLAPRCIFIGPGAWGRTLVPHVREHFELVAVVSTGAPGTTTWLGTHCPDVPSTTSVTEGLTAPDLDAVFIATPTATHPELVEAALDAGCHVFVEKPLALQPRDAARLATLASARGLELFIGYVHAYHAAVARLLDVAPPSTVEALAFDWVRPQLVGRPRHELLCHELALTVRLSGELPDRLDVWEDGERSFRATMHLPSGRSGTIDLRVPTGGTKRKTVVVRCRDGGTHRWRGDVVTSTSAAGTSAVEVSRPDAVHGEIAAFRAAVDGSGPRMVDDPRLSVGITELLAAAS